MGVSRQHWSGLPCLLQIVLPQGSDLRLSCLLGWLCLFSDQGVHLCSSDCTITSSNWHFFGQDPCAFKSPLFYTVVSDSFVTPWTVAPPFCSVHGTSQARILELVAISFPRGSSWPRDWTHVSLAGLFFTTQPSKKPIVLISSSKSVFVKRNEWMNVSSYLKSPNRNFPNFLFMLHYCHCLISWIHENT